MIRLLDDAAVVPAREDLETLDDVRIVQVRPHDDLDFVHGAHLSVVGEELWCSFAHNSGEENTRTESCLLRVSTDGGRSWGPDSTVADAEPDFGVSHGVLLGAVDQPPIFLLGVVADGMQSIGTRRYVWDADSERWNGPEWVADGFWPLQEPMRLPSGALAMAGVWTSDGLPYLPRAAAPPAVLVSPDGSGAEWRMVVPYVDCPGSYWGESSLLVDGGAALLVARSSPEVGVLLAATSDDGGLGWSATSVTDLPFTSSKPHIGRLSTGEPYLVGTSFAGVTSERTVLTISLGRPRSRRFCATYALRFAETEGLPDSTPTSALSYPHAIEHDGVLHVAYSNDGGRRYNRNSVELATIPVERLREAVRTA